MERRRIHVSYSGQVQGVGFRYQTKRLAAGYEIVGHVRNVPDGTVELVAEGESGELEAFREAIRKCGLGPLIRDEKISWSTPRGDFRGFEIVR
ncbi:MAG TPA: acylphosphatase [Candidatus Limnocylindria bacterium]|jgi:acylphosphatase|nr:acylphosphatase [Candidatus Limnocylindria bacterium]